MKKKTAETEPIRKLLTRRQAAERLGVSKATLDTWSCKRIGPPIIRLTPAILRYDEAELERWIASRPVTMAS